MICKRIEYENYRNIKSGVLEPSPETTIICGRNAQGKTNAVEGIFIFANGKSHRALHDSELVAFGSDFARVTMVFDADGREQKMSLIIPQKGGKQCFYNGVKLDRLSEMIGGFRAVMFCPEHLGIVKEGPSARRSFIDGAICQLRPLYMRTLQRYNTILYQRNALLRAAQKSGSAPALDEWSCQLAEYAARIAVTRYEYTEKLSGLASDLYADMSGGREALELHYHGTSRLGGDYGDIDRVKRIYERQFLDAQEREIVLGTTLHGIHKDDIDITLDGRDARYFASQGQQRSAVLTMKLAEGEYSHIETGEYPVFLLDDILSELDPTRRSYVTSGIGGRQVIITACDASAERRIRGGVKFFVKNGNLTKMTK